MSMSTPIFSQAAIFRLQQLAGAVHRQTGVRYKLSNLEHLIALLQVAAQTTHPEVALHYRAFFSLLNSAQRQSLTQNGWAAPGPLTRRQAI